MLLEWDRNTHKFKAGFGYFLESKIARVERRKLEIYTVY